MLNILHSSSKISFVVLWGKKSCSWRFLWLCPIPIWKVLPNFFTLITQKYLLWPGLSPQFGVSWAPKACSHPLSQSLSCCVINCFFIYLPYSPTAFQSALHIVCKLDKIKSDAINPWLKPFYCSLPPSEKVQSFMGLKRPFVIWPCWPPISSYHFHPCFLHCNTELLKVFHSGPWFLNSLCTESFAPFCQKCSSLLDI